MATPLGHALVGAVSYATVCPRKRWRLVEALACCLFAFLPDLDVLFSAVTTGKVGTFHRTFTHTPVAALAVFSAVLGGGLLAKKKLTPKIGFWATFAGFLTFTHYLMDVWVRLPYFPRLWTGESSLLEVLVAELQQPAAFNYLTDLIVYGGVYTILILSLKLLAKKIAR